MDKQFITTVNGIEIAAVRDEELNFFVPVKPLCEAIGVDPEAQRQRIMRHYILGSTAFTLKVVAADEKEREMLCLPLEYVYGWLFTIDANLVSEVNRENVKRYQLECYRALYTHFAGSLRRRVECDCDIDRSPWYRKYESALSDAITTTIELLDSKG